MKFTALFFVFVFFVSSSLFSQDPVTGLWRNIDDETGKPKAEIQIYEENGVIYGKVIKLLDKKEPNPLCKKCPAEFKDKPIEGLRIMWGIRREGNKYTDGNILDPKNGNIYKCRIELVEPNKLKVRGFLGISALGRTQYWYRIQ